ncbi:lytic transglycosylase domain-containing protein [Aestuariibacter halophilus]|uniref:Lytic transglycosylase domain-containing protein n=1 Tax=Fluctibacter halophilus TaxID=226011 RepID=A0ABS8GBP6_9ALTE|nr:lytic transglycosylase domain-containing protein [Aestuariibacter halophilus]MCC2618007.1 lytic transglycosylase domain-containing protein [Aestuariibacter halophilus]
MSKAAFVSVLFVFLVTTSLARGQTPIADENTLIHQRKMFEKAEHVATNPKSWDYQYLEKQLKGYPLWPYIELKTLMAFPYLSNRDKIDRFLDAYADTPLDEPLRKRWLTYLAQKDQQALFLHYYRDIGDDRLACIALDYRVRRDGQKPATMKEVEDFWLVGKSQPKECDRPFKVWQQAGLRTTEHVWQRLTMAADGGKHTLIPYLKTLLPANQRYLADLWLKTRRAPSFVSRLSQFPGTFSEKEADILAYGLSRLIWRDRELALSSYENAVKRFRFNGEQMARIAERFAISLASKNHPEAEVWLERANDHVQNEELFRWHLAYVLRQQDWQHAMDVIDMADEQLPPDYAYQYWRARAYEELDAPQQAQIELASLADKRHYYGFLASGKLAQAPKFVDRPLQFSAADLSDMANRPAVRRAYEFLQLGRYVSARREWYALRDRLEERELLMAAVLADSWGWHDQTIFTLSRAGYMDDVKRRFPMAYSDQLMTSARQQNIDPAWAFAIARRESSFMADAYSGAGARGLMQLMPGTARYLAKKKVSTNTLYDPEQNARFGTQYLRYLLDKMADNPILATASYNAGWRRVKDWIPAQGSVPVDVWIETIPYKETRNYVKAVLAYKQIYAHQLGNTDNLFENIAAMQINSTLLQ